MIRSTRILAIACAAAATFGPLANQGDACCFLHDLFGGCCARPACDPCGPQPTTTYRPMFSWFGHGCHRPCAPQTCSYAPTTCYRNECVSVPVTTYRPCTTCDPCTGCPTTVLRPMTSYVRQVRRVPFTTYRPVYGCSPCGTGCSTASYGYSGSSCSSGCGSGACGTSGAISSPAADYPSHTESTLQTSPGRAAAPAENESEFETSPEGADSEPELEDEGDAGPQSTFETSPSSRYNRPAPTEDEQSPLDEVGEPAEIDEPQLLAPKERETRRPASRRAVYRTTELSAKENVTARAKSGAPAKSVEKARTEAAKPGPLKTGPLKTGPLKTGPLKTRNLKTGPIDDGGWRAARR